MARPAILFFRDDRATRLSMLNTLREKLRRYRQIRAMPRVATIATMPTRLESFEQVVERILPQVDRLHVFLDRFETVPDFLLNNSKIVILRSQEAGDLHASGRFLVLQALDTPSIVVVVDDDIRYPANYVARLVNQLAIRSGDAVVGVHGTQFTPPFLSYVADLHRSPFFFHHSKSKVMDELGCGTCAFLSDVMNFDIRTWLYTDANDIQLALEAKRRRLPLVCIKRRSNWLRPIGEEQPDSIWVKTKADHSRQTALMRILMSDAIAGIETPPN